VLHARLDSDRFGALPVYGLQVYVSQLSTQDENLVIAAEGLIQVSPPKEIATLLQHFKAGSLIDTKRALCAIKEQQMDIRKQQEEADAAAGRVSSASKSAKRTAAGAAEVVFNPLAEVRAEEAYAARSRQDKGVELRCSEPAVSVPGRMRLLMCAVLKAIGVPPF
jgi:hypothetical protein